MKRPSSLLFPCLLLAPFAAGISRADTTAWQNLVTSGATPAAATNFTPVHGLNPVIFDVGALGGPATYEFLINAGDAGASSAMLGLAGVQGLKFEQNPNLGVFGLTVYGIADHASAVGSILNRNIHVVYACDGTDTVLHINGEPVHTFSGAAITLSGPVGLGAAQSGENFFDRMDGSVLGFASYAAVLSDAEIAERSAAFAADQPPAPDLEAWRTTVTATAPAPVATHFDVVSGMAPVVVDVGEMTGPRTFEFVVNAGDVPTSSALLGRLSSQALKFEQSPNTGSFGVTDFGVADHNAGVIAPLNEVCHIAYVYDGTDTNIFLNGEAAGSLFGVPLDLHRELGLGAAANIPALFSYRDPLSGSVLRFASYDIALSPAEVATHSAAFAADAGAEEFTAWQAATAAGTAPAATLFTPVSGADPTVKDVGALSGDRSFEFIVNAVHGGGSAALMGNALDGAGEGLKMEQNPNTGVIGITKFGIADHVSTTSSPFGVDAHIVYTSDGIDTLLYVNGELTHTFSGVALDSAGEQGIASVANAFTSPPAPTFFDRMAGHVLGFAAYGAALTPEQIAAHHAALTTPAGGGKFVITSITRNAATGAVTLTWPSRPGEQYRIRQSPTLSGFTLSADNIDAAPGATTTHTFTPTTPAAARMFFIVEEKE